MIETSLTGQQVNALIKIRKKSTMILDVFFLLWRLVGICGIAACIFNLFNIGQKNVTAFDIFTNIIMVIIGVPIIAGFFLGIPWLLTRSEKKKIKSLKKGNYKVYISYVTDKHCRHTEGSNKYSVSVSGVQTTINTDSMNYGTISVGQEVYVLLVEKEYLCYSPEYLSQCINYASQRRD